jgi:hypothetical protein
MLSTGSETLTEHSEDIFKLAEDGQAQRRLVATHHQIMCRFYRARRDLSGGFFGIAGSSRFGFVLNESNNSYRRSDCV